MLSFLCNLINRQVPLLILQMLREKCLSRHVEFSTFTNGRVLQNYLICGSP